MKSIIIGTSGHIDHGKTELIKVLTGIDADRLKEEKERGITIDIGFASLKFGEDLLVGFIDVPGHERFVKNMLAGAASIDFVLLVVAADESVKPQTVEHFEICALLGIKSGIIVLTKIDLVDEELIHIAEMEVRELAKGSFLENAPIVHVSSKTGSGIDALKELIRSMALQIDEKNEEGLVRLPVDRSFSMKGFGTVVTGTLVSGRIRLGDELEILPAGVRCRVRGVEVHGEQRSFARAGQRTALNLASVGYLDIERGQTLATPGTLRPAMIIDAKLVLLESARALKDLSKVRFHYGTSEVMARVKLLERDMMLPGDQMYVQLRMEKPVIVLPGDKFIIRFYSPMITIGGGVVVDNFPTKHRAGESAVLERMSVFDSGTDLEKIRLLIALSEEKGASLTELERRSGKRRGKIETVLESLMGAREILEIEGEHNFYVSKSVFDAMMQRAETELKNFHRGHPLIPGMGKEELKRKVAEYLDPALFNCLLQSLDVSGKIKIDAATVAHQDHKVQLNPLEQEIKNYLEEKIKNGKLDPPEPQKIIEASGYKRELVEKILRLLLKEGLLIKVKEDRIYHANCIDELKEKLGRYAQNKSIIEIASFKELAGITRKNAIPLLEYFDSIRVTKRMGNERLIMKENIRKD